MKKSIIAGIFFILLFIAACEGPGNAYSETSVKGYPVIIGSKNNLMWEFAAPTDPLYAVKKKTFTKAVERCSGLDYAKFTDWRLPTIEELRSVVRGYGPLEEGGRCGVTDTCLAQTCLEKDVKTPNDHFCDNPQTSGDRIWGPGADGCYLDPVWGAYACYPYWSSSPVGQAETPSAWSLEFSEPAISAVPTDNSGVAFVRCVRTYSSDDIKEETPDN